MRQALSQARIMTRWILLLLSLGALLLMFLGPSPAWVALGLFGFLFGSIATTLAFAHVRISRQSRQDHPDIHLMSRDRPSHRPTVSSYDDTPPS